MQMSPVYACRTYGTKQGLSLIHILTPALTTIHCDFKEIADRSVEALIDSIEGKVEKSHQELPLEFVKRESLAFHKE